MSGEPTSDVLPPWKRVLLAAANESFAKHRKGVLLSTVPGLLRRAGVEPADVFGGYKVRYFLNLFGQPELRLLQNDKNPVLWILLPADEQLDRPPADYFPASQSPPFSERPNRFKAPVWKAFVTVLPEGFRRWMRVEHPTMFIDLPESEPSDLIEVERDFVRSDDLFLENLEVASRIEKWAALHQVPLAILTLRPDSVEAVKPRRSGNPLGELLKVLSDEDLRRISLPADIVARFI